MRWRPRRWWLPVLLALAGAVAITAAYHPLRQWWRVRADDRFAHALICQIQHDLPPVEREFPLVAGISRAPLTHRRVSGGVYWAAYLAGRVNVAIAVQTQGYSCDQVRYHLGWAAPGHRLLVQLAVIGGGREGDAIRARIQRAIQGRLNRLFPGRDLRPLGPAAPLRLYMRR